MTHVIFGDNFNQSIDQLPASVIQIEFKCDDDDDDGIDYSDFNQPINQLPSGLTHLKLLSKFHSSDYEWTI